MTPDPDEAPDTPSARALTLPEFTPVPRAKDRHNGWKPDVQRAFIEALAETGSVKSAARRVGRAEVGAYLLRRHPEAAEFRKAWDAALDIGMRRIEDVAMDRALHGHEQPVYSYGKLVGSRTVYNDRLLMFMLRNRAPERFGGSPKRGPDAVDKMELARLKKRWRREWEAEKEEEELREDAKVRASLDEFLEGMRQRRLAAMTPRTRAMEEALARARAEDMEAYRAHAAHPMLPGVAWPRLSGPGDEDIEEADWEDAG